MELFEAIEKRHCCRDLVAADVPRADLEKIMDAGRRAASGMNIQPFSFIAITERDTIQKLSAAQGFIAGASAAIAIVADPSESSYWLEDVAAAAENMLLAIEAMGYASTWVEGTLRSKEDELKRCLDIPEQLRFMVLLPIGKPAAPGAQPPKKPLSKLVHWEKW